MKTKISVIATLSVLALAISFYYINTHVFIFRIPVLFQKPLSIEKRVLKTVVINNITVSQDNLPLNANEKYLCQVFGDQCKTALIIQHMENGTEQCDRFHVNANGSVDFGFMQVNSVHLKLGVTIGDLVDCRKNIDIAYQIYKSSGWPAWSTYKELGLK